MFSSAELIEALRRRRRRSLRPPPPPGEFPPGWRDWFQAMALRPGRVTGARAEDIVAAAAMRKPRVLPAPAGSPGRWRAFGLLWRPGWEPAARDERWVRVTAMSGSLLLHLLLALAAVWLMLIRFHFDAPEAEARDGEEHVLQVEYIGEGTPADAGGGEAGAPAQATAAPEPESLPRPAPAPAEATPLAEIAPAVEAAAPDAQHAAQAEPVEAELLPLPSLQRDAVVEVPVLEVPEVPVATQALQVTEVEVADPRFEVPPPGEVLPDVPPQVQPREVAVRERAVEVELSPATRAPEVPAPRRLELAVPAPASPEVAVRERQPGLARVSAVSAPGLRQPVAVRAPDPAAPEQAVRERSLPMPAPRPEPARPQAVASAAPAAADAAPPSGRASANPGADLPASGASPAAAAADAGAGSTAPAPGPGAGRLAGRPPGALPSTRASDDWGDSDRNVAGGQTGRPGGSGLFNADGSVRLADGGRVGGGLPPGVITEDFEKVDRHGTWLKRPPYDYEPTSFDRFWLPSETLLEEWVRASVTEVLIPIPGTTKSIRCVTVLLALGGGCGIVDPNLQEQPAGARPPPTVPFKRDLQEDQDSLGPPAPPES